MRNTEPILIMEAMCISGVDVKWLTTATFCKCKSWQRREEWNARSHERKGDINISFSFVPYIAIVATKEVDRTKCDNALEYDPKDCVRWRCRASTNQYHGPLQLQVPGSSMPRTPLPTQVAGKY